ncbi:putative reverse transcriptase domain-containing protein [Tanacetum coccineum]
MIRATQPATIQSVILKDGALTDEAVRCGTLSKSIEKRKEIEGPSKQGGSWSHNKRVKVGKGFVATGTTRNEYAGSHPKCAKCNAHQPESGPCRLCYNCQKPSHITRDCRSAGRQVALINAVRMGNSQRACYKCGCPDHLLNTCLKLNRAPGQVGNRFTIEGNQNPRNNGNQARGRAFNVNAIEAPDFNFISTEFVSLLNVKPSILRPSYVIEVANGKMMKIDRIIRGCILELKDSLFTIDLTPFGHGSFGVIVGMDWLSKHKVEIVYHEKVVRIPLATGEVLQVHGERTEKKSKISKEYESRRTKIRRHPDCARLP